MATPAAILEVFVQANTTRASGSLRKFDRTLATTARTASVTGARTAASLERSTVAARGLAVAGKAAAATTRRIGSAARTATPYIAGGLALGLGKAVIEAREAYKVGKQTEAVIKSTGGAAKVTAIQVEELAAALSLKTGIDDEAIQSSANLLLTFKNIRNETGAGNKIFDQATRSVTDMSVAMDQSAKSSAIQLGKALNDPILGLTSLSRVGVQFTEQQKEQIATLVESGKTLTAQKIILRELTSEFGGSAAAQADSFDKLKVAGENFAESIGKKITPTLSKMADEVSDIFRIKGDKQRLNAVGDFIDKWGTKAIKAFGELAPMIAETFAKLAGKAATAFFHAFQAADVWGKLFLAGALIRLIGGPGVFGKVGQAAGKKFGGGFVLGTVLALPLLVPEAYKLGRKIGEALRNGIGGTVADFIKGGMTTPLGRQDVRDAFLGGNLAFEDASDALKQMGFTTQKAAEIVNHWLGKMGEAQEKAGTGFEELGKHAKAGGKVTEASATGAGHKVNEFSRGAASDLDKTARAAGEFGNTSGRNFDKVGASSGRMKGDVAANFGSLTDTVFQGLKRIGSNVNQVLSSFGVQKLTFNLAESIGAGANAKGHQRGGLIVGGSGTGDKVPAMLEPGEVVINRKAVAAMGGARRANAINSMVPRFASGGVIQQALGPYSIPPIAYDPNHAGGNSHLHLDFFQNSQTVAYGKKMQGMGWSIGEYSGPAVAGFGGITTQHQSPGHYDGTAFDANTAADETRSQVAAVARLLNSGAVGGAIGGAIAEKIKRVMLEGPAGPLLGMGQAALDKVRSAANAYISKRAPRMDTTSMDGGASTGLPTSGGALSRGQMRKLVDAHKLADIMGYVAYAESGFNPAARNPSSGASGLWQFLPSTWAGLGVSGSPFNPDDAAEGARRLYGQAGLGPWEASRSAGVGGGWGQHMGQAFAKGGIVSPWAQNTIQRFAMLDKIRKLRGSTATLDEQIANAQIIDAMASSPSGADLSAGERSGQVGLGQRLLGLLTQRAGLISKVLPTLPKGGRRKSLVQELVGIQGLTGSGGRILDARAALDALSGTSTSGPDLGALASLYQQLYQQQLETTQLYRSQMPIFAGWKASGGSFTVDRPTIFGAGEAGREHVAITPADGDDAPWELHLHGVVGLESEIDAYVTRAGRKSKRMKIVPGQRVGS